MSRKGRDKSGHVDPFYHRRLKFDAVLRALGLQAQFASLSREAQELFWKRKWPDPVLRFDETFPRDLALRRELEQAHRAASVKFEGHSIEVRDFLGVVLSLKLITEGTTCWKMFPPNVQNFVNTMYPCVKQLYDAHHEAALKELGWSVIRPLVAHSRLDQCLLMPTLDMATMVNQRFTPRMTVSAITASDHQRMLDEPGRPRRPVYRAASWWYGKGPQWVSWDRSSLRKGAEGQIPVFVQSHALRQLESRVKLKLTEPYLHSWLCDALAEPNIVEQKDNDLLIEFRLNEHRIGYLVATAMDDIVLVRTFLFLTMQGTPEFKKLHRRLGLTRHEVDWLRLNELSSFLKTDLRTDAKLRGVFDKCGCGHLFTMDEEVYAPQPEPYAGELRKYLRMAA